MAISSAKYGSAASRFARFEVELAADALNHHIGQCANALLRVCGPRSKICWTIGANVQTLRKASSPAPHLERQHVEALILSMQKAPILKKHGKNPEVGAVDSKTVSNYPFPAVRSRTLLTER